MWHECKNPSCLFPCARDWINTPPEHRLYYEPVHSDFKNFKIKPITEAPRDKPIYHLMRKCLEKIEQTLQKQIDSSFYWGDINHETINSLDFSNEWEQYKAEINAFTAGKSSPAISLG